MSEQIASSLHLGDLNLDTRTKTVYRAGKKIYLTPHEFKLLQYLLENQGSLVSRNMILTHIWRYAEDVKTRVVDVYIGYLRKKIDAGFDKKLIHAIRGQGYAIKE